MVHSSKERGRVKSTRTRVLRDPELVLMELVRPTDKVYSADCRHISYSPICLVEHSDGFLYIVDGNHRFYKKIKSEKECSKILAWVLREGDQDNLNGDRIPGNLVKWKTGKITLEQLASMANFAWNYSMPKPKLPPAPLPASQKFTLVIDLIKEKISIEEASQKFSLPESTIVEWLHVSLRAMRDALQMNRRL